MSQELDVQAAHAVLPAEAALKYLAEGAANIVYRISVDEHLCNIDNRFRGKLLRLRKDLPTTVPRRDAWTQWDSHIRPLFPPHAIVLQELVSLKGSRRITTLNDELRASESMTNEATEGGIKRPYGRHNVYLADDPYGLLVTDMTPGSDAIMIEFRPKWLAQSPTAPDNAIRCRNCAMRARRSSATYRATAPHASPTATFCSLRFVSDDISDQKIIATKVLLASIPAFTADQPDSIILTNRLAKWLHGNPLLQLLTSHQTTRDAKEMLFSTSDNNPKAPGITDLLIAMTLRDCSMFVSIPHNPDRTITAKLGDLDLKSAAKIPDWKRKERELINEGWYEGRDGRYMGCILEPSTSLNGQ